MLKRTPPTTLRTTLPYPPSVNHYWRHVGPKTLISREGRLYRDHVCLLLAGCVPLVGALRFTATFHPPDNRRRDLDNLPKALLDALTHAGAIGDDCQVRHMDIRFGEVVKGGRAVVVLEAAG